MEPPGLDISVVTGRPRPLPLPLPAEDLEVLVALVVASALPVAMISYKETYGGVDQGDVAVAKGKRKRRLRTPAAYDRS